MNPIYDKENQYNQKVYSKVERNGHNKNRLDASRFFIFKIKSKDLELRISHDYQPTYNPRDYDPTEETDVFIKAKAGVLVDSSNKTKEKADKKGYVEIYADHYRGGVPLAGSLYGKTTASPKAFYSGIIANLLYTFQYYLSNKKELLANSKYSDEEIQKVFLENIKKACAGDILRDYDRKMLDLPKSEKEICDELFGEGTIDIEKAIESQVDEQLKIMEKEASREKLKASIKAPICRLAKFLKNKIRENNSRKKVVNKSNNENNNNELGM